jgi:hypothetical protein
MKHLQVRLTGLPGSALLTHNERLASRMDPIAREMSAIASKRKKTDDDLNEMARLELLGGCYITDDGLVGIPAWNVFRSIQDGARLNKLGRHVERGVVPASVDIVPIKHAGPATPAGMWDAACFDQRSVKVGQSKVTRTRPRFTDWVVDVEFYLDTEILQLNDFQMVTENAGRLVGLGDYRPRFGRFDIDITEVG